MEDKEELQESASRPRCVCLERELKDARREWALRGGCLACCATTASFAAPSSCAACAAASLATASRSPIHGLLPISSRPFDAALNVTYSSVFQSRLSHDAKRFCVKSTPEVASSKYEREIMNKGLLSQVALIYERPDGSCFPALV